MHKTSGTEQYPELLEDVQVVRMGLTLLSVITEQPIDHDPALFCLFTLLFPGQVASSEIGFI